MLCHDIDEDGQRGVHNRELTWINSNIGTSFAVAHYQPVGEQHSEGVNMVTKPEQPDGFWTSEPDADPVVERASLVMAARSMIVARRALEGPLPADIIADPVIDVLMALYVAQADGRTLAAAELERATTVSSGVTRRWLSAIVAQGLIAIDDAGVSLTTDGDTRVTAAIRAVIRSQIGLHGPA